MVFSFPVWLVEHKHPSIFFSVKLTTRISAFQSPESSGADISEYRLEWGEDEESLELIYHGTDTGFEIRALLPAAQYCCRLQVGSRHSDLQTLVSHGRLLGKLTHRLMMDKKDDVGKESF